MPTYKKKLFHILLKKQNIIKRNQIIKNYFAYALNTLEFTHLTQHLQTSFKKYFLHSMNSEMHTSIWWEKSINNVKINLCH